MKILRSELVKIIHEEAARAKKLKGLYEEKAKILKKLNELYEDEENVEEGWFNKKLTREKALELINSHPTKRDVYAKYSELAQQNPAEYPEAAEKYINFWMNNPSAAAVVWDKAKQDFVDRSSYSAPQEAPSGGNDPLGNFEE